MGVEELVKLRAENARLKEEGARLKEEVEMWKSDSQLTLRKNNYYLAQPCITDEDFNDEETLLRYDGTAWSSAHKKRVYKFTCPRRDYANFAWSTDVDPPLSHIRSAGTSCISSQRSIGNIYPCSGKKGTSTSAQMTRCRCGTEWTATKTATVATVKKMSSETARRNREKLLNR